MDIEPVPINVKSVVATPCTFLRLDAAVSYSPPNETTDLCSSAALPQLLFVIIRERNKSGVTHSLALGFAENCCIGASRYLVYIPIHK